MTYFLTTEVMRVVQKNDRGVVTKRKRYTRGDEVDADLLPEGRLEQLLESGSLVESEDEVPTGESNESPSTVTAAANFVTAGSTSTATHMEAGTAVSPVDEAGGDPEDDIDADDASGGDRYDSMSYPELQQEAKARTGDGSGGKDDLLARLRKQDEYDADTTEPTPPPTA